MSESFLPFFKPDIGDDEINEVVKSLRSGWLTTGPVTKLFEEQFAKLYDNDLNCIAVNSATSGLHLALEAIGISTGDEVITTTYTFTATAEIIRYLGATPVFVDINPSTFCIDIDAVASAITPRTKAIIPVHFAGLACDMDPLFALASQFNLHVVEDAAHALPTTYKGHLIGSLRSHATVFSFYANKTMTTGEGGMLVTNNSSIANRARIMRLHGISRDAFDRFTSEYPSWYYQVVAPGYKYNMTDISASIGIHQLAKIYTLQAKRASHAAFYDAALSGLPLTLPPKPMHGDLHSWHLYVVQLNTPSKISRDRFVQSMFDQGIGCSVHYIPLHLHPYWRDNFCLNKKDFPHAQNLYESSVSLPLYPQMTNDDLHRVVNAVKTCLL